MTSDSIIIRRSLAGLRRTALLLAGSVLVSPVAAQSVYRFHESGGPRQMVEAAWEIAIKARPGASDASVITALGRHVSQSSTIERWDRNYLVSIPPPYDVGNLTRRSAALRQESVIVETAPVLYAVQEATGTKGGQVAVVAKGSRGRPGAKGGAPQPDDERLRRLASLRIVTTRVLADLTAEGKDAGRIQQSTGALTAEPLGSGDWWLFTYETPRDALDAAYWMTETAKLVATPDFERMHFTRQDSTKMTPSDTLYGSQWHLTRSPTA